MRLVNPYVSVHEPIEVGNIEIMPIPSNKTEPETFKRSRNEAVPVGLEVGTFEFDLSVERLHQVYP